MGQLSPAVLHCGEDPGVVLLVLHAVLASQHPRPTDPRSPGLELVNLILDGVRTTRALYAPPETPTDVSRRATKAFKTLLSADEDEVASARTFLGDEAELFDTYFMHYLSPPNAALAGVRLPLAARRQTALEKAGQSAAAAAGSSTGP